MRRYFVLPPGHNEPIEVDSRQEWSRWRRTVGDDIMMRTELRRLGVTVETRFVGQWDHRFQFGIMFEHKVIGLDARWRYFTSPTYAAAVDKHARIVAKAIRLHQQKFGFGDTLPLPRFVQEGER